ncbi:hypothetical protein [Pigmentiphaga daeguensis]
MLIEAVPSISSKPQGFAGYHAIPIGFYWPGQGGIYAGSIRGSCSSYHLIVPLYGQAEFAPCQWEHDTPLAASPDDGRANTRAMLANGHALAKQVSALEIDGHRDFYIPAKRELALCEINLAHLFQATQYWSSTQCGRDYAWALSFDSGTLNDWPKKLEFHAKAVRRINYTCLAKHRIETKRNIAYEG